MLPFLVKEEAENRRLETQLQQKECRISNLEASLAKTQSECERIKTEVDRLQNVLRESNTKLLNRESQLERYSKELKQKKEHSAWLQEQLNQKKSEIEKTTMKLQDVQSKCRQKEEEAEILKAELQTARRELDQTKMTLEKTEVQSARLKSEATKEIHRLNNELGSKVESIRLLEMSNNGRELNEEQKVILEKAACYEKLSKEVKEKQKEVEAAKEKLEHAKDLANELIHVKKELEAAQKVTSQVQQERNRFADNVDESRKLLSHYSGVESERDRMQKALQDLEMDRNCYKEKLEVVSREMECTRMKSEAMEQSSERVKTKFLQNDEELNGMRAACLRLEDENKKLYDHVSYAESQLVLAKAAIDSKQGILENERALGAGEKKIHDSMERLVQSLRLELEESRRQIAELSGKDKRAADAINALEKKLEQAKIEKTQSHSVHQFLDKELKASQVETLRLQQALNGVTSKLEIYKNRVGSLKEEMAASERSVQDGLTRRAKTLEEGQDPLLLLERIKMLEADLIVERNAHGVTKQHLLRQERESRCTTHVSTPFPRAGSSFRFSYARPGDRSSQGDNDTPAFMQSQDQSLQLTPVSAAGKVDRSSTEEGTSSVVTIDPKEVSAVEVSQKDHPLLTPVHEMEQPVEEDEGAMEVDGGNEGQQKDFKKFFTPGPKTSAAERHRLLFVQNPEARRSTYDLHEISVQCFQDADQENQKNPQRQS